MIGASSPAAMLPPPGGGTRTPPVRRRARSAAQDRAVATQAAQMALQARVEQAMQEREGREEAANDGGAAAFELVDTAVRAAYGAGAATTTPGASISVFA
ncbi:hypothetical protein [Pseudazoarcus pumilus]|uniref:Uncharacterized protein n=1 Tax=Pseudazoarcus pumilus TaxID=2067960 RepID=A0A2I6S496_9RHOO|nr:hypothetical protein [Pseudazoarcus pumilus]AUN94058.1 hypothetical protein C0099_03305 [Pseudazoarcus pumilus]